MYTRLTHASLGPPESIPQTGARSIQPFLYSSRQTVAILYNGPPFFHSKLPIRVGYLDSYLIYVPWAQTSPQPIRQLDRFGRFCRADDRDRQTGHATPSVTIGRIYVVLQCGLKTVVLETLLELIGTFSSTVDCKTEYVSRGNGHKT